MCSGEKAKNTSSIKFELIAIENLLQQSHLIRDTSVNMPAKTPQVKLILKQLSKPELLKFAESKKANIPSAWDKGKIVDTLSTIASANEVTTFISKKTKTKTKEAQGLESALKGKALEDRVVEIFTHKGFQCKKNIRFAGMEIDVYSEKKGGIFSNPEFVYCRV